MLNHLLLVIAVLALAHAGLRIAAKAGAEGPQLPIGATVVAARTAAPIATCMPVAPSAAAPRRPALARASTAMTRSR